MINFYSEIGAILAFDWFDRSVGPTARVKTISQKQPMQPTRTCWTNSPDGVRCGF